MRIARGRVGKFKAQSSKLKGSSKGQAPVVIRCEMEFGNECGIVALLWCLAIPLSFEL